MPTEPNDWPGSEESITARAKEITGPDAADAASNILMCIGRGATVTISMHFAIEAVAGLRALAALPVPPTEQEFERSVTIQIDDALEVG